MPQASGSVSRAISELLLSKPMILTALELGVVNYSALARLLKEEVEERIGREVSDTSVKMAIIRFRDRLVESLTGSRREVLDVIARSSLSLIDDIGLATIRASDPLSLMSKIAEVVPRARFLQLTQGIYTFTVVADVETLERIIEATEKTLVEVVYKDQAAIVVVSPREIITTPGVIAYLTTLLAFNGINLTQIISAHTDTIFILRRDDAIRAYRVLCGAINTARGTSKT
ncbi:MAG: ACT domain-containing protein [Thermoprotei archaeon]|nr:MAG: ACT domain-containing protein [Thermoprotei archaeon]